MRSVDVDSPPTESLDEVAAETLSRSGGSSPQGGMYSQSMMGQRAPSLRETVYSTTQYQHQQQAQPQMAPNDTWVTVFGFPPRAAANILDAFRSVGTILQYELSDGALFFSFFCRFRLILLPLQATGCTCGSPTSFLRSAR